LALLTAGARPIEREPGTAPLWHKAERFGCTSEQIADAVIAEWQATCRTGLLAFATPAVVPDDTLTASPGD
jgi:hypothetical protein